MSKEIAQTVGGKRIAWLLVIVAAIVLFATVGSRAQSAHAATLTDPTATSQTALVSSYSNNFLPSTAGLGQQHDALSLRNVTVTGKWMSGSAYAPHSTVRGNPWATMDTGANRSSVRSGSATLMSLIVGIDGKVLASDIRVTGVNVLVPDWGAFIRTTGAKTQYAQVGSQQMPKLFSFEAISPSTLIILVLGLIIVASIVSSTTWTRRHFGYSSSGPSGPGSPNLFRALKGAITERNGAPIQESDDIADAKDIDSAHRN